MRLIDADAFQQWMLEHQHSASENEKNDQGDSVDRETYYSVQSLIDTMNCQAPTVELPRACLFGVEMRDGVNKFIMHILDDPYVQKVGVTNCPTSVDLLLGDSSMEAVNCVIHNYCTWFEENPEVPYFEVFLEWAGDKNYAFNGIWQIRGVIIASVLSQKMMDMKHFTSQMYTTEYRA